jgi:3',5'-cyclic-AMP phosphodiesterase
MPFLDAIGLRRPERLGEVIRGTDVRLIISGHVHYSGLATLAGVPVWVASAAAYRTDVAAGAAVYRGVTGSAFTRIDMVDGQPITTQIEDPRQADEVYTMHVAGRDVVIESDVH